VYLNFGYNKICLYIFLCSLSRTQRNRVEWRNNLNNVTQYICLAWILLFNSFSWC